MMCMNVIQQLLASIEIKELLECVEVQIVVRGKNAFINIITNNEKDR